ncbi:MAG: hypothetical protein EBY47_06850, partial [Actinobacteria bacterium]|nr:hypothetical protein [Actinomycetota bacterium]
MTLLMRPLLTCVRAGLSALLSIVLVVAGSSSVWAAEGVDSTVVDEADVVNDDGTTDDATTDDAATDDAATD